MESPMYIKSLVIPHSKHANSRRVWSIDLEAVWLPFFTATNVMGDTTIPHEAMGSPLRLALNKDGTPRFTDSGKPVIRVVKDIGDMVRIVRENFTAGLMSYTNGVATENPDSFRAEVIMNAEAGKPFIAHDNALLMAYAKAKAEAEAEATPAPAPKVKAEPKPKARKVKASKPATNTPTNGDMPIPDTAKELVAVS